MGSLLRMEKISKSFGHVRALQNVDLTLEQGEILGLIGDNAAGKSTLMKVLSGLYPSDEGQIYLGGERAQFSSPLDSRRMGIEMIYQDFALAPDLSVTANIFLGKEVYTGLFADPLKFMKSREMEREAEKALARLDLKLASVKARVVDLSGGEQQGVAIARAMSFNPTILIMDEPTANLSVEKIGRLLERVKALRDQTGVSMIFISHRLEDVFSVSDRIMVLKSGRRVGDRKIEDITMGEAIQMMIGALSDFQ